MSGRNRKRQALLSRRFSSHYSALRHDAALATRPGRIGEGKLFFERAKERLFYFIFFNDFRKYKIFEIQILMTRFKVIDLRQLPTCCQTEMALVEGARRGVSPLAQ